MKKEPKTEERNVSLPLTRRENTTARRKYFVVFNIVISLL
jgi:hypothetical protein